MEERKKNELNAAAFFPCFLPSTQFLASLYSAWEFVNRISREEEEGTVNIYGQEFCGRADSDIDLLPATDKLFAVRKIGRSHPPGSSLEGVQRQITRRVKQQLGREKKEACALVASGYERGEINNEQQPRQPKGFRTCMGPTVLAGGQASMQEQL